MNRPDDNKKFCFAMIMMVANKFQTKLDKQTGELTLKQWLLLCMLSNMEEEHVSLNDLAAVVGYSRQNTKKMVNLLVKKDYVMLEQSGIDKRAYDVKLTLKSLEFFKDFQKLGDQILENLFERIEEEKLKATAQVLEALYEKLETL